VRHWRREEHGVERGSRSPDSMAMATRNNTKCGRWQAWDGGGWVIWRCRLHGGLSTGPKTAEGLARIAAAARARCARRDPLDPAN
jgi:hypothetical protein